MKLMSLRLFSFPRIYGGFPCTCVRRSVRMTDCEEVSAAGRAGVQAVASRQMSILFLYLDLNVVGVFLFSNVPRYR